MTLDGSALLRYLSETELAAARLEQDMIACCGPDALPWHGMCPSCKLKSIRARGLGDRSKDLRDALATYGLACRQCGALYVCRSDYPYCDRCDALLLACDGSDECDCYNCAADVDDGAE